MSPKNYLANMITYRAIGSLDRIQAKARARGISANKIRIRQSRIRANFCNDALRYSLAKGEYKPEIITSNRSNGKVYFAKFSVGKETIVAFGATAKEAYDIGYGYFRTENEAAHQRMKRASDEMAYRIHIKTGAIKADYPLTPSDILAPKHGRLIN